MPLSSPPTLLDKILRATPRRYRVLALPAVGVPMHSRNLSTLLALLIEQARQSMARGNDPGATLKHRFVQTLAQMIRDAMCTDSGDPAYRAMVLCHRDALVREYGSLSEQAAQDRRAIRGIVDAIAHPGKQQQRLPGWQRDAMARLYAATSSSFISWSELSDIAGQLLTLPQITSEPAFQHGVMRILKSPELERAQRLEALSTMDVIGQYQALLDKQGPRAGSQEAVAQGVTSQQRGAAVETSAAKALQALADRLNRHEHADQRHTQAELEKDVYRVVTSMHVPASLASHSDYAKTEWDGVLLRRADTVDASMIWDVCLFVEAKASLDAVAADFPRLLRGLELLAQADGSVVYSFMIREGEVQVRGASLCALTTGRADLKRTVLYCCDAPVEASPRLLSAANRMRLLTDQASLEFASKLARKQDPDPQDLAFVWDQLLKSSRWHGVLHQYPDLQHVRELTAHPDDVLTTVQYPALSVSG